MAPHVHTTFIGLRMWHRATFESAERASIDLQTIVPEVHGTSPSACRQPYRHTSIGRAAKPLANRPHTPQRRRPYSLYANRDLSNPSCGEREHGGGDERGAHDDSSHATSSKPDARKVRRRRRRVRPSPSVLEPAHELLSRNVARFESRTHRQQEAHVQLHHQNRPVQSLARALQRMSRARAVHV